MEIKGYKAFDKDSRNRYGCSFTPGETYHVDGEIKFGNIGNGYHFCKELCDVFRYVDTSEDIKVAEVTGFGKFVRYDDEYYGYYDMYAIESIRIDRFLQREEIIAHMLLTNEVNCKKFLGMFPLTDEEKKMFLRRFKNNMSMIEFLLYYQFGYTQIYEMRMREKKEVVRKVLAYGQDSNKRS